MSYLLDTNVLSEPLRLRPEPKVTAWLDELDPELLHISVISVGEFRRGIEILRPDARRERLTSWLTATLPHWLGERILPITIPVADRWGRLRAELKKTMPVADSLIAATALHHDLRLVTRNDRDFSHVPGLTIVNPWDF